MKWNCFISDFRGTFAALTGIAALAYFVQNCVISICRNQRHPENNVSDIFPPLVIYNTSYVHVINVSKKLFNH